MLEMRQKFAGGTSKKKLLIAGIVGGIVIILAAAFWILGRQPVRQKLSISPMQLLPYVSHEQARATICGEADGQLFSDVCQEQYDHVGKNDKEKIGKLFLLLEKVKNDRSISDYERLLLAQAIFASLPIKDSPLAQHTDFYALLAKIKDFIIRENIAYAKESNGNSGMGEEGFKKMMLADLTAVVNSLPKGDNAWVINVSVSKYGWVNGERQPLYSEQYAESVDPYPGVSTENKAEREQYDMTHVGSRIGSFATSQDMYSGPLKEGSGEMIAYSFSIASWESKPYGSDSELVVVEAGPSEKYFSSRYNFTEENYQGNNLLSDLLDNVKMPDRSKIITNQQEKNKSSEKITPTAWGSPYESETAYEAYFWMHVRDPSRFPNLWALLANDQEASGKMLRDLPLGSPVDLRKYFRSAEVREYYEFLRENTTTTTIPPLDEFLEHIDDYQSNLSMPKPPEKPEEEEPPAEGTGGMSPEEAEYRRWLDSI